MITKIQKRDGRTVPFSVDKIADAIYKAARAVGGNDYDSAAELAEKSGVSLPGIYEEIRSRCPADDCDSI